MQDMGLKDGRRLWSYTCMYVKPTTGIFSNIRDRKGTNKQRPGMHHSGMDRLAIPPQFGQKNKSLKEQRP
jgi:hypothetical protein